jgi:hypothetical protein
MDFERKATVQAHDSFPANVDIAELDKFIREQKVPGELVIVYPGNSGRTSVIFNNKKRVFNGEISKD